jgi:hypothetical protein
MSGFHPPASEGLREEQKLVVLIRHSAGASAKVARNDAPHQQFGLLMRRDLWHFQDGSGNIGEQLAPSPSPLVPLPHGTSKEGQSVAGVKVCWLPSHNGRTSTGRAQRVIWVLIRL